VEPGWNLCAYEKLRTVHLYLAIRSSALIEPSQYEPGTQMDLPKTEAGTLISGSNRLVRASCLCLLLRFPGIVLRFHFRQLLIFIVYFQQFLILVYGGDHVRLLSTHGFRASTSSVKSHGSRCSA